FRSTVGLLVGKPGGADGEGQRTEQAGFLRRVQDEALQQEDEGGRDRGMHGDEAPFLHGLAPPNCLIRETTHQVVSFSVVGPLIGAENWRPFCGPGFGGLPEAKPSSTLPKLSLVRSSNVSFQISTIGAFTQAPRHSTSSQLKLPSSDRWKGSWWMRLWQTSIISAAPRNRHGVVPQTWIWAFLPTVCSWNIV